MSAYFTTPPALAKRWNVSPDKILAWIRTGQLRAINLAERIGGRPRWKIAEADIQDFERRRAATPVPKRVRRTRKKDPDFIHYYT